MAGLKKTKSKSAKGYIVGGEAFRTKKAVTERVQGILYAYELGQSLNPDDFFFIYDLLSNHKNADEKIGCGVASITVEQNPTFRTKRNFWVIRKDGSKTDFSFLKCITPVTPMKQFRSACRNAVVNQIQQFKIVHFRKYANEQGLVKCPITEQWVNREMAHVDHIHPQTFDNLVRTFIEERNIDINSIEYKKLTDGMIGRDLADENLVSDWAEYHRQNAQLQIISRTANLSIVKKQ